VQPKLPRMAEFFSGAGMVRAALGESWQVALANDIDARKCAAYAANWGADALVAGDISALDPALLRQPIDLYWASSPCQDLSLAGNRLGLSGARSGVFHAWMAHVNGAAAAGFAPRILAFENVTGILSSGEGQDFRAVCAAFHKAGYRFGALEIDARHFLPQSRPRVFVLAVRGDIVLPDGLIANRAGSVFHSKRVLKAVNALPRALRKNWLWWTPPPPTGHIALLANLIDVDLDRPDLAVDPARLMALMSDLNRAKVARAQAAGGVQVGTVYKRGRPDATGNVRQRAEARFDGLAGCLRTPAGGSSRQTLMIIRDGQISARLMTPREAARLMGLADSYILPEAYNEAYKLSGDGVAVPVVSYLNDTIFLPVMAASSLARAA
jgi:DNA (cytosine-5)-methyltransferase 1